MVNSVVGEETRLKSAEERLAQSAIPAEVGLVIGKLSWRLDRGFIYELVPTPPNDAGDPPCSIIEPPKADNNNNNQKKKKPPKSSVDSSSLFIDRDWVSEHARQVSRLLVGGVKIVGIYVWAADTSFKNSTSLLCQTVKVVADAAPSLENGFDEMLLLHISYSPRRWTCRSCSVSSNVTSSSLRPCDFKLGRLLNSLQRFQCMYHFCMRLPICRGNPSYGKTLNDVLLNRISIHTKELNGAKAIIDGNLVDAIADEPCTSDDVHKVELLLPAMKDVSLEASSQKDVVGILVYSGVVCSYSYLNSKEPISQAVADIKEDIIMSLRSRLDMIVDEADREIAAVSEAGSEIDLTMSGIKSTYWIVQQCVRTQCILPFPRRVFIPWLAGTFICDYLLPAETYEALKDHVAELLSMEAPADDSTLWQPEKELSTLTAMLFWDVAAPSYHASDVIQIEKKSWNDAMDGGSNSMTRNFNGLFACFVLFIAIILGSLFYSETIVEDKYS